MLNKLKYWLGFCLLLASGLATAQMPQVEMADAMRENGKIYVVVAIVAIIFLGIVAYLIVIDRKLRKLEKEIDK